MTARACPHPFPFRWHRTIAEVDKASENRTFGVAMFDVCAMEMADREGAANACPGPDLDHPFEEGERL